jgi:hypothetical protein
MTRLISDTSMSLDGCVAGPNYRPEEPLGTGVQAGRNHLHVRHRPDRG